MGMLAVTACGGDDGGGSAASSSSEEDRSATSGPVHGGHLVYGIEADTSDPFAPYAAGYATGGYVLLNSLTDTLFTVKDDGEIAPMLVESYTSNDDHTQWTFNIRDGVKFHDGTVLDAEAVKFNIDTCRFSPVTGSALGYIDQLEASGQVLTITTKTPQVGLPYNFVERQCAHMMSAKWLASLDDVPHRTEGTPVYDAALAATPATGDAQSPVGLGAFVFESYTPGNGNSFKAVRFDDYWRGPNGVTGEQLPYLDSIEAVVAVDEESRSNGLRSGQFDLIHTSSTDSAAQMSKVGSIEAISSSTFGDTNYFMLNVAEGADDPEGENASSPMLNLHCRRALAYGMDSERLAEERGAGLVEVANGPFGPGRPGYLKDTGYPSYDPDKARAEMDRCLSELGTDRISFRLGTTNDPFNVETNALIISIWSEIFGNQIDVAVDAVEQGSYIGLAVVGKFHATSWRSHGGVDPASEAKWWESSASAPIGSSSINFGRIRDAELDAALATLQTEGDETLRRQAAEEVSRIFGEKVYGLWWSWAVWTVLQQPHVNGVESNALIGGGDGVGLAFSGLHQMNQIWCDGGKCE